MIEVTRAQGNEEYEPGREDIEIDLSDSGMLWYINRVALHPRGYALAALWDNDSKSGPPTGFTLLGDGTEPFVFSEEVDDEYFERTEATFEAARAAALERNS